MDAIVTAGGIPQPEDPLYTYTHGDSKALVDVAGRPMIQWVLDALGQAGEVEHVIIAGLSPKSGLTCRKPLHYVPHQGRMLANLTAGIEKLLERNPKARHALVVSSDLPGLKSEMVDWLAGTVKGMREQVCYGVVPRAVMEKRYPGAKRAYTRMKDMQFCEAGLHILDVRMAPGHLQAWEALVNHPRGLFGQAGAFGFGNLWSLLLRRLTLAEALERVCARIGITGRLVVWKQAEPGMRVEGPRELELVRVDMEKQVKRAVRQQGRKTRKAGKDQQTRKTGKTGAA